MNQWGTNQTIEEKKIKKLQHQFKQVNHRSSMKVKEFTNVPKIVDEVSIFSSRLNLRKVISLL